MPELSYQCAHCNSPLVACKKCGLLFHLEFAEHLCLKSNAGKMRVCPFEVVAVDTPCVGCGLNKEQHEDKRQYRPAVAEVKRA